MKQRVMLVRPAYNRPGVTRTSVASKPQSGNPHPPDPSLRGGHKGGCGTLAGQEKIQYVEVANLVDKLSPEDRQKLLDNLALQASVPDPAADRDVEMWSVAIYEALQEALGPAARAMGGPLIIKRVVGSTSQWRSVADFMQSAGFADLKVVERQSVYMLLADLLVKYAKGIARHSNVPLSPKLVGNCVANLAGVFDQSFPGYLEAGLAHVIVKRLTNGVPM